MKEGIPLARLTETLLAQEETKRDFIADTRKIKLTGGAEVPIKMEVELPEGGTIFDVTDICHSQIGQHLKIPKPYYDRMRSEAPELLRDNVNHWLQTNHTPRMVRTMDNTARAFLSDRYRPLDNADLARFILPALAKTELQVQSCDLTPTRMYIKAVSDKVEGEIRVGEPVRAGVVISNSEIGAGALCIQPLIFTLACLNGMIRQENQMRQIHSGGRHASPGNDAWEVYSDATKKQSDKATFMQAHDMVEAFLRQDYFDKMLEDVRAAANQKLESDDLPRIIEVTADKFDFSEEEGNDVLRHLAEGGDMTRWGLSSAITRTAHDVDSYDRATELERIGGMVIELPRRDWELIAAA